MFIERRYATELFLGVDCLRVMLSLALSISWLFEMVEGLCLVGEMVKLLSELSLASLPREGSV